MKRSWLRTWRAVALVASIPACLAQSPNPPVSPAQVSQQTADELRRQQEDLKKRVEELQNQLNSVPRNAATGDQLNAAINELNQKINEQQQALDKRIDQTQATQKYSQLKQLIEGLTPPSDDHFNGDIEIRRAILEPKQVSDIFGRRIGERYIAFQVTIINRRTDMQLRIQDLSLDFCALVAEQLKGVLQRAESQLQRGRIDDDIDGLIQQLKAAQAQSYCVASSQELALLRGIAEKGQALDRRNLLLHLLQASGAIMGAFAPAGQVVTSTTATTGSTTSALSKFTKFTSVFSGPGLAGYATVFPDYTVTQSQRLSDTAYAANVIVPQQQSKVIVAFLPQALFLDHDARKKFWNDPNTVIEKGTLTKINAHVMAQFIVDLDATPPQVNPVDMSDAQQQGLFADPPHATGRITGKYLAGCTLTLDNGDNLGLKLTKATTNNDEINFEIGGDKKLAQNSLELQFSVKKKTATVEKKLSVTKK